jgi:chromosome segregation ATPase
MNKDKIKNLALILLLGISAFSMIRYVSELKARFRLQDSLTQSQGEVAALTQEEQNLLQELGKEKELNTQLTAKNVNLKAYLKASKERITRSFRDISKAQNELEDVSAKFSVLKAENKALIDSRKRIYLENEQFKLKLSSVVELKKLIRELKFGKSRTPDLGTEGNQGFLIKDGRSTLEKIKIEVIPAPYKSPRDSTGPAKTKE